VPGTFLKVPSVDNGDCQTVELCGLLEFTSRSTKVVDPMGAPTTAYWFAKYAFHPGTEVFISDLKQLRLKSLNSVY